jgi:diguanylate cyclase (GGDEF)-like protein
VHGTHKGIIDLTRPSPDARTLAPLSREAMFRQVGPLIGGTLMGLLFLAATHTGGSSALIFRAAAITAFTVMATAMLPWHRLPSVLQTVPALLYMVVVLLLVQATGGSGSVYEQLVLLPVLWLAVFATTGELAVGLLVAAAVLLAPLLGEPNGSQGLGRAFLLTGLCAVLGFSVQRILLQIRATTSRLDLLARTDELTGVANRRAWDEYLSHVLERATNERFPVCLAMLDVDHFKEFNDRHGHQAGDRFLKEITARWRSRLRETDVLARLGGDEFAMVLPNCELAAAHAILARLATDLPGDQACSAGLACWDSQESAEALIARADTALYEAKRKGRARVVVAAAPGSGRAA